MNIPKSCRRCAVLWWAVVGVLAGTAGAAPSRPVSKPAGDDRRLSLAGEWRFQMDPQDRGVQEAWFRQDLPNRLLLPGSLQAQGYGEDPSVRTPWTGEIQDRSYYTEARYEPYRQPGNVKFPFWLTPWKHYVGPVWYHREVLVPPGWKGKRVLLSLERCHWETTVWVDGQLAGTGNSLSTPHVYDLSTLLPPGPHRLVLRVDNRVKIGVGVNAHSVSDHTQGNWNGVVGALELTATEPLHIADVQVYPQVASRTARVVLTLGNATPRRLRGEITLRAASTNTPTSHSVPVFRGEADLAPGQASLEIVYPLGERMLPWDEFNPALYKLDVTLQSRSDIWNYADTRQVTFGMRDLATEGTQFTVNGRRIFLRGTLECAIFPSTGYPPTDVDSWKQILRTCKAHGLNHMRFHSWCPPEAAFVAADELGFYFQIECAAWANSGSTIGDGQPIDAWIYAEGDRILRAFGNHPSFLFLAYGNEPAGDHQKQYLGLLLKHWKSRDPRRLYTSAAGWPAIPENDFHSTPEPRIYRWGEQLNSRINARPPETTTDYRDYVSRAQVPLVSHEIGQWCVYPNFDEIQKYAGFFTPGNFEIFRDHLRERGMGDQARDFLLASGKLQALCYKEEIESALRTPGFGGFQLLDLHDFPGQGTALVGVLDAFWESKGYIAPREFSRFCGPTVPLARLQKRTWTADETLTAALEIAHFGAAPIPDAKVYWKVLDARGKTRAEATLPPATIPIGNGTSLGTIAVPLADFKTAEVLKLVVGIDKHRVENDWDLWVFPPSLEAAPGTNTLVAEALTEPVLAHLDAGGTVLLMPPPARIAGDVQMGFSSIFWNTAWTQGQAPHTLGILCRPSHPALANFPTDFHSNWQWWDLIHSGAATVMDDLPPSLRPIVQVVDDWFKNRRLGLIFEARLGKGKLLFTSLDLRRNLEQRPAARQLLHSLLRYLDSDAFRPDQELTPEHLTRLMRMEAPSEASKP